MNQTAPTFSRPTAADILRRAEHLLTRPHGWLATRLVGFELTHPPATHIPAHGWSEVVATWDGDLPSASEITAVGRALVESAGECRAVYTHADAGVLCHQLGSQFTFSPSALEALSVC